MQYKSTRQVRRVSNFFRASTEECWRFVPEKKLHALWYVSEASSPTSIPLGESHYYMNCFNGQEDFDLIPFTKKFPNIEDYFRHVNTLREEYFRKEQAANTAETRLLSQSS